MIVSMTEIILLLELPDCKVSND